MTARPTASRHAPINDQMLRKFIFEMKRSRRRKSGSQTRGRKVHRRQYYLKVSLNYAHRQNFGTYCGTDFLAMTSITVSIGINTTKI
jgi:hypothetical protein